MAGRIKADDLALVKERTDLEDIVREHVTLRSAGPGSMKGLCPFHDEKTPSFTIRPAVGAYHCFGCGEGGDVIEFVMKVEHLPFAEAVERLAAKAGIELHYEEGARPREESIGRRTRLIEAHRVAQEFYIEQLHAPGDARAARDFLRSKGFDGTSSARFGVGFAPRGFDELAQHLRAKGFSADELVLGGLAGRGQRGLLDRFRGRVVWPIRDITGDTIGFGARRIFDDDRIEAKYLNTAETPIYKKSQVLYGLDLAKREMARERRAVIVEGYTDVMAAHLSGVTQAVATCGTAFGIEHIKLLRRILRDEPEREPATVVFTFDGDAAGQKAAMKAFAEDQRWAAQSFVAVAAEGQDPCDLRLNQGEQAVRDLVDQAVPMFEFAVRTTIERFDLDRAEGRVLAMRAAAPMIAGIRDAVLRPQYVRTVAGWLGVQVDELGREVARAGKRPATPSRAGQPAAQPESENESSAPVLPMPDLRNPVVALERQLLQAMLQFASGLPAAEVAALSPSDFIAPAHRAVFEAICTARAGAQHPARIDPVLASAPPEVASLVRELAVAPLPTRLDADGRPDARYLTSLVWGLQEASLNRQIGEAMSQVQRAGEDRERSRSAAAALSELQRRLMYLRERLA